MGTNKGRKGGGERPGVDERLVRFEVLPPAIQPTRGEPHRTDRQAKVTGARGQGRSEVRQCFGSPGDHAGKGADLCRFPLCPAGRREGGCRQSGISGFRNFSRSSASRPTASEPSAAGNRPGSDCSLLRSLSKKLIRTKGGIRS